jgi:hypothetical protein
MHTTVENNQIMTPDISITGGPVSLNLNPNNGGTITGEFKTMNLTAGYKYAPTTGIITMSTTYKTSSGLRYTGSFSARSGGGAILITGAVVVGALYPPAIPALVPAVAPALR